LQAHAHGIAQMAEVIALQDHVVEFEEGHRLFAFQPQLHRIKTQHAVDREMRADLLQHFDIANLAQPIMVVDHDGVGRAVAEGQKLFEGAAD
jgi:hypothetical protein